MHRLSTGAVRLVFLKYYRDYKGTHLNFSLALIFTFTFYFKSSYFAPEALYPDWLV